MQIKKFQYTRATVTVTTSFIAYLEEDECLRVKDPDFHSFLSNVRFVALSLCPYMSEAIVIGNVACFQYVIVGEEKVYVVIPAFVDLAVTVAVYLS
jgi:hypothetical protein